MATNEIFREGDNLSLPVATGILSGTPLRLGAINCIATTDEGSVTRTPAPGLWVQPSGGIGNAPGYASVRTSGAWNVAVTGALTLGQIVYIKSDNTLTATSTGNKVWGKALRAKGTGTGNVIVKIVDVESDVVAA
jgi:predicted RecA/RadA family phage recombinase